MYMFEVLELQLQVLSQVVLVDDITDDEPDMFVHMQLVDEVEVLI